jgi:16S rRNA (cytidine1402-2'-O)-methyltransferase
MNSKTGNLFIVATPIGNLGDMSNRAITVLTQVQLILAEDTRHAAKLLMHYSISTKTRSFHDQNENAQYAGVVELLQQGMDIALISDAGTPLISDPGYRLVREARIHGITVTPVPGPSALIAALSASGLATDRFCFEGFLPAKHQQRMQVLCQLKDEPRTLIFYESSHRILPSLEAMAECFGGNRVVTVAREISKKFETFYFDTVEQVIARIQQDANNQKGEFVVVVSASQERDLEYDRAVLLLKSLVTEMPIKSACKIVADTFNVNKNKLYEIALDFKK